MNDDSNNTTGERSCDAAVVVPVYRDVRDADEEISLRHLQTFLGAHDKFLVAPASLNVNLAGFGVRRFADEFFHSTATYSALLLSGEFYRAFARYKYILVYQLDALVFSDQLDDWCATDLDYIGAPWLEGDGVDFVEGATVGNGGFSLRKVESFLRVTEAPGFSAELEKYRDALDAAKPWHARLPRLPRKAWRRLRLSTASGRDILSAGAHVPPGERLNEDCFWSFKATQYDPDFKIASVADALRFSFELNPRRCFELNGRQLPFGCHAWNKYDRKFWEPFLLK
jgi:hypothetical protein